MFVASLQVEGYICTSIVGLLKSFRASVLSCSRCCEALNGLLHFPQVQGTTLPPYREYVLALGVPLEISKADYIVSKTSV